MKPSMRLGRVAGIEVDLHWSVVPIMLCSRGASRTQPCLSSRRDIPTACTGSQALLERMSTAGGHRAGRALIFEGEELVGIVSPTDVRRAIDLAALRAPGPHPAQAVVSS